MKRLYILLFFTTVLSLLFSDNIYNIQEIRKDYNIISKKMEKESIVVSKTEWNSYSDKSEIVHDGNYYDVSSFEIIQDKVHVKAFHDKFEIIIKAIQKNISLKHKLKNKKTIDLFYYFNSFKQNKFSNNYSKLFIPYTLVFKKTNLSSIFRPPIFN